MASYRDKHNIIHNQLKYHIFSFPFLLILPENDDFIGKTEKIGKLSKILLDLETEKNIYDSAMCACRCKQLIKSNIVVVFNVVYGLSRQQCKAKVAIVFCPRWKSFLSQCRLKFESTKKPEDIIKNEATALHLGSAMTVHFRED